MSRSDARGKEHKYTIDTAVQNRHLAKHIIFINDEEIKAKYYLECMELLRVVVFDHNVLARLTARRCASLYHMNMWIGLPHLPFRESTNIFPPVRPRTFFWSCPSHKPLAPHFASSHRLAAGLLRLSQCQRRQGLSRIHMVYLITRARMSF